MSEVTDEQLIREINALPQRALARMLRDACTVTAEEAAERYRLENQARAAQYTPRPAY